VPLIGTGQERTGVRRTLDSLPFWSAVATTPSVRRKLPLGALAEGRGECAEDLTAFLGRSELEFTLFDSDRGKDGEAAISRNTFGLVDEQAKSVVFYAAGELVGSA
jgi:hypothetical protein